MFKAVTAAIIALPFAIALQPAKAEPVGQHMYEAVKTDPALAAEFARIMKPISATASWVDSFGTTAPSTLETVDEQAYSVYWGCKPHDCIAESYVVMYNLRTKEIAAGAFVQNNYDGPNLTMSNITWLGKTDFDLARALGKYLY